MNELNQKNNSYSNNVDHNNMEKAFEVENVKKEDLPVTKIHEKLSELIGRVIINSADLSAIVKVFFGSKPDERLYAEYNIPFVQEVANHSIEETLIALSALLDAQHEIIYAAAEEIGHPMVCKTKSV